MQERNICDIELGSDFVLTTKIHVIKEDIGKLDFHQN